GDFDGDGRSDLVVAEDELVVFHHANADRTFDPLGSAIPAASATSGNTIQHLATADFDRNGRPDVVSQAQSGDARVAYNTGGANFVADAGNPYTPTLGSEGAGNVAVGDFDGDLNPDFVVTNFGFSSFQINGQVFLNQLPHPTLSTVTTSPNPSVCG